MHYVYHATVGAAGRVVIPVQVRRALHVREGDFVAFEVDGETVRLANQDAVLKDLQSYFRNGIPDGVSLVEELLEERRDEARQESTRPHD